MLLPSTVRRAVLSVSFTDSYAMQSPTRRTWQSIRQFSAPQHTDTVELSPSAKSALCGCYQYDNVSQLRMGALLVFSYRTDEANYQLTQELSGCGVLDLCWINDDLAMGASAEGQLTVWQFNSQHGTVTEQPVAVIKIAEAIVLSLDCSQKVVICSDSSGHLHQLTMRAGQDLYPTFSVEGHQFEAWCAALDRRQECLFYSGGDDCVCRVWDTRSSSKVAVLTIRHEMGVCSVRQHPLNENVISTGCYDERVRIWDLRNIGANSPSSSLVFTCSVGGGVWRHKWSPAGHWILAAGMHAGFALVRPSLSTNTSTTALPIARYRTDAKLAYGADWHCVSESLTHLEATVATCSFSDNTVDFSRLSIVPAGIGDCIA